jgi:hypothetical protein
VPGRTAATLTVWDPILQALARSGFGLIGGIANVDELDDAARTVAEERAEQGASSPATSASALLGSVSHALLEHADGPVLVVPSPQIAEHRRDQRHATERTLA